MGILEKIAGRRTYLDVNVFIYALEGHPQYLSVVQELFGAIDRGDIRAVTSELSLAEALVKPLAEGRTDLQDLYARAIAPAPFLDVVPVTREVLIEAARIRARDSARLPDAIHLATAIQSRCQIVLTNDTRIRAAASLELVQLSQFTMQP